MKKRPGGGGAHDSIEKMPDQKLEDRVKSPLENRVTPKPRVAEMNLYGAEGGT
jgi:hypothetical protein